MNNHALQDIAAVTRVELICWVFISLVTALVFVSFDFSTPFGVAILAGIGLMDAKLFVKLLLAQRLITIRTRELNRIHGIVWQYICQQYLIYLERGILNKSLNP